MWSLKKRELLVANKKDAKACKIETNCSEGIMKWEREREEGPSPIEQWFGGAFRVLLSLANTDQVSRWKCVQRRSMRDIQGIDRADVGAVTSFS